MQRSNRIRPASRRRLGHRTRRMWAALGIALAIGSAGLVAPTVAATAATSKAPDQWAGFYGTGGNSSTNAGEHTLTTSTAGKVRQAFATKGLNVGPYPPVVRGGVVYSVGGSTSPKFYATSPKTGKVVWSITLPYTVNSYGAGMTGTGSTVLIAFRTRSDGGVLAVNTAKRSVAWRSSFPASTRAGFDSTYPGPPSTDGTRVFLSGSSNTINAFAVSTGKFLWGKPYTTNSNGTLAAVYGFAAGYGFVYTSGDEGLVAYNAGTGKKVWASTPAISVGVPVLTGSRVFVNGGNVVEAFKAAGCRKSSCRPSWSTAVDSYDFNGIGIAGADSSSLFISYRTARPGGSTQCASAFIGHIARLSASTGKTQWQTSVGDFTQGIVRGGNVIWLVNEYVNSKCEADRYRLLAYSTAATKTTPLASVTIAGPYFGYPQSLSVAAGTVFQSPNSDALVGYRVPGT